MVTAVVEGQPVLDTSKIYLWQKMKVVTTEDSSLRHLKQHAHTFKEKEDNDHSDEFPYRDQLGNCQN